MIDPKVRRISLSMLAGELNSGRPVMLVPLYCPLQPPGSELVLVPIKGVHPGLEPALLRLNVCGDSGLLLVEDRRGGSHHG